MRKLTMTILVLVALLVLTTVASASPPEPAEFTMTGYTTWYEYEALPSGRTKFYLTAQGGAETAQDDQYCAALAAQSQLPPEVDTCTELCVALTSQEACGIDGFLQGSFTFEEWGIVDLDLATGLGSGLGTNRGRLTITTDDGDEVLIRFAGKTDSADVWGKFTVLQGTGNLANLRGQGDYSGDAGFVFTVTYTGRFHSSRK